MRPFQHAATELSLQDKRTAQELSSQTMSRSSFLLKYSLSISSLITRKHAIFVLIGSFILISTVVISLLVYCRTRSRRPSAKKRLLIKSNGFNLHSPCILANGKRIASSSPIRTRQSYDEDSPTHNYTSLRTMKPVLAIAASSSLSSPSSSSSSIDSRTRTNTVQNRTINTAYTYAAIRTSDELMPVDCDDHHDETHSGIELMMTTV